MASSRGAVPERVTSFREAVVRQAADGVSLSGYERDALYLNEGGTRFDDISGISGLDSVSDGRASVYADFDNDGDVDVYLTTIQHQSALLFRNDIVATPAWLRVSLKGTKSGTDAFGAIVRVKFSGGVQTKVKSGGEGYMSQHDPRLLFGLGSDAAAEWIEVTWPSGTVERFENIPARTSIRITEGRGAVERVRERTARFGAKPPNAKNEPERIAVSVMRDGKRARFVDAAAPLARTTLVPVWATWCSLCVAEVLGLERARELLARDGIRVVGINLDDPAERMDAFVAKHRIGFRSYSAAEGTSAQLAPGGMQLPMMLVLDARGGVREKLVGAHEIRRYVAALERKGGR